MASTITYYQINKDHAYWTEKRRVGQMAGGHTSGLLTYTKDNRTVSNLLFDAGCGTIDGLHDLGTFTWEGTLDIFVTHGHIDHHAELMLLSELWCKRETPVKRGPVRVFCTGSETEPYDGTIKHLRACHGYGFGKGNTLSHVPVPPDKPTDCGVFRIHTIPVDHFAGAVIYVAEFAGHKLVIGWDMKTLPDPDHQPILKNPSLALIEANTWSPLSERTGHTSVEEVVRTGFLDKLEASVDETSHYGLYLVHFGGGEDPGGTISDGDLELRLRQTFPQLSRVLGVARRGQRWLFPQVRGSDLHSTL